MEARLILALECLAYGKSIKHKGTHYSMSTSLGYDACRNFDRVMSQLYKEDLLSVPTSEDLKNISTLHEKKWKVKGLFGFLDCCHTWWDDCPKGHQSSYKGKESHSTIVVEAA